MRPQNSSQLKAVHGTKFTFGSFRSACFKVSIHVFSQKVTYPDTNQMLRSFGMKDYLLSAVFDKNTPWKNIVLLPHC